MNEDRFSGEAAEPEAVCRCDYCGAAIRFGCAYYAYEGQDICEGCAGRFAWQEFLRLSGRRQAGPERG